MLQHVFKNNLFFLLVTYLCSSSTISAQTGAFFAHPFYSGEQGQPISSIHLSGTYDVNSTSLTNTMLQRMLFGGYIDKSLKDQNKKQLQNTHNRLGMEVQPELLVKIAGKKWMYIASLRHRELALADFSNDLYTTWLYGNKGYEGRNAALGPVHFSYFSYQSISGGLGRQLTERVRMEGTLSLVRAGQYQHLASDRAQLFTAPSGEYLQLDTDLRLAYHTKPAWGGALGLLVNYTTPKSQLTASISDVGVVYARNQTTYNANGTYTFEGVQLDNLFTGITDSVFQNTDSKSLAKSFGISPQSQKGAIWLPATVFMSYQYKVSSKLAAYASARQIILHSNIPRIQGKVIWLPAATWQISAGVGYGGFGKGNIEIGIWKSWRALSVFVEGYGLGWPIAPQTSKGHGIRVGSCVVF